MSRKGLTSDSILSAAAELVEEKGFDRFSLRELAAKLEVKPASLYNHMENVSQLTVGVGHVALKTLKSRLQAVDRGGSAAERLLAMAEEYRRYAKDNPELYKAIVHLPAFSDESLREESHAVLEVLYGILEDCDIQKEEKLHFARAYRSAMHGFVSLEEAGAFFGKADADESYRYLIEGLLSRLEYITERGKENAE